MSEIQALRKQTQTLKACLAILALAFVAREFVPMALAQGAKPTKSRADAIAERLFRGLAAKIADGHVDQTGQALTDKQAKATYDYYFKHCKVQGATLARLEILAKNSKLSPAGVRRLLARVEGDPLFSTAPQWSDVALKAYIENAEHKEASLRKLLALIK